MQRQKHLIAYSKELRQKSTQWEDKLWKHLRAGRFYGLKFKRQVPINGVIVDFCCNQIRLIIELDGYYHRFSITDDLRDKNFEQIGYDVLRFWDSEVEKNIDKVLEKIKRTAKLKNSQPLSSSPQAWGENL